MKAEILHVWKALHYSADGLIATFRNETAFRLELIMAVVLIPIALILPLKGIEKVMLIGIRPSGAGGGITQYRSRIGRRQSF